MTFSFHSSLLAANYLLVIVTLFTCVTSDSLNVAPGYYAFESATSRHGSPPRVRPPPYYSSELPCTGVINNGFMYSPRDTLCGDLNKGFIPKNPMGHAIHNQPYPFELIKNKTLHFLAKALPYLKDDIDSIPKVVKLTKDHFNPSGESSPGAPFGDSSSTYNLQGGSRKKRSILPSPGKVRSAKLLQDDESKDNSTMNHNLGLSELPVISSSSASTTSAPSSPSLSSSSLNSESRQKPCESKDGIMCQVMQSLGSGSLMGTINQASQLIQAAQTLGSLGSSTMSLASLVQQLSSPQGSKNSGLSQIMTLLETPPSTSSSSSSNLFSSAAPETGVPSGTSNFSPILAVLDYLATNSQEKSGLGGSLSSILPARRKKPMDLEEIASEAVAAVNSAQVNPGAINNGQGNPMSGRVPPTPCPSLEEYIAPVFARNYQGVWKYIVQIPHEGYFTQTVQKTSCTKSKCDFMDGSCHESPRWVSLLVAEIFYPDARFPNPVQPSNLHLTIDQSPSSFHQPSKQPHPQQQAQYQPQYQESFSQPQQSYPHPHQNQMYPQMSQSQLHHFQAAQQMQQQPFGPINNNQNWRSSDNLSARKQSTNRRYQRQMNLGDSSENEKKTNNLDSSSSSSSSSKPDVDPECDGVDKVGCYLIRVYYDWFLVPGSCKCWKKNTQGSLDTLKKIFIGK